MTEGRRDGLTDEQRDLVAEWVFDMCEEYDLPFTNNEPRVQDGVQLRHVGEFAGDLLDLVTALMADAWDKGNKTVPGYYNPYSDEAAHLSCDQTRCCKTHGIHADPHRGCILR